MFLDLRAVRGPVDVVERAFPGPAFASETRDEFEVAATIDLALQVRKDGDTYRLQGRLATTVRRSCCRCLEPFDVPASLDIDVRYLPHRVNTGEGEREIADDDLSIAFYRDDQINLGDLVREQLELAAPMKPLCGERCRGLCPVCGANLNSDACGCETAWRDPRLDALRSLLPEAADAGPVPED
jgi:uncharacterized protein